jgi:prevent-host-death family protein
MPAGSQRAAGWIGAYEEPTDWWLNRGTTSCIVAEGLREVQVQSYSVEEARTRFAEIVQKALAGEPQRVSRHGQNAVMVISEAEWLKQSAVTSGNLGAALLAMGDAGAFADDALDRPAWLEPARELGSDFI